MDYKKDVRIDKHALDIEWLEQPALAKQYGDHWALCKRKVTELEEEIKVKRSELVQEANKTLAKATNPAVEAYYRTHKDHKALKQEWIEAQYEENMAFVAKQEICMTRKASLEQLVKLHGQQYFSTPQVKSGEGGEMVEELQEKRGNNRVGTKLKRTK